MVVCAEAVEEAEDLWVVTIAGAMVDGEMAATGKCVVLFTCHF